MDNNSRQQQRRRSSVSSDPPQQQHQHPAIRPPSSSTSRQQRQSDPFSPSSFNLDGLGPSSPTHQQQQQQQQSDGPLYPGGFHPDDDGGFGELLEEEEALPTDPFFAGRELYRALRGTQQADDPLADELLWEGDFMSTQREVMQKRQEDELLERLERRMGRIRAAPVKKGASQGGAEDPAAAAALGRAEAARSPSPGASGSGGGAPPGLGGLAMAAATGVKLKNLLGRVMPSSPAAAEPGAGGSGLLTSLSGGVAGRFGSAFSSAPGQLTAAQQSSSDGPLLSIQDPTAAAAAQQTTTPRFLERLTSSLRRQRSRKSIEAAAGPLGVLVAENDSSKLAGLGAEPAAAAAALPGSVVAGDAGDAAAQAVGAAGAAAPQSAEASGAGGVQAADAVVQVKVVAAAEKKLTVKQQEAKDRAAQEALQRMDTDARLQMEVDTYSWARRMAVKVCTHSDFELIVMLLIFGNCISLALYNPMQPDDSPHNATLTKFDLGLNVAFTLEMLLRIVSMGGLFAYLRHPWNLFDCVMVLAGYTTFIPMGDSNSAGLEGVKALRALRALRPLRTITRFAALRSIVVCFLEAVPLLVSVAAMLFFFLFLFAVAGAEIFGDAFHYGCVDPGTGRLEQDSVKVADEFSCGDRQCPAAFSECQLFHQSLATQIAGFENVGLSMLSVFQAMTLTNWSFTMYRTMDFLSPAVVIYWFVMIVFGAYFVLNLFLAVLKTKFAKAKNLLDDKRRQRRAMKDGRQGGSKKRNVLAKATIWMKSRVASYVSSRAGQDSLSSHVAVVMAKKTASEFGDFADTPRSGLTGFSDFIASQPGGADSQGSGAAAVTAAAAGGASLGILDGCASMRPTAGRQLERSMSGGSGMSGYSGYSGATGVTAASAVSAECLLSFEEFDESVQDLPVVKRSLLRAQYRVRALVCSSWFNNFFLLAIIMNTVALAIMYDGMSHEVEEALALANFVFTGIFTLEMVLKLAGLGPWRYLSDPWSLFDALVVAFSLVELVTELMARSSATGLTALRSVKSLRVLRSFRVLRVMKLFKYLESLKMIAAVLISSMASFASIVVLLVLFWLVFSIVGLHVFGGLELDVPWPNCDSLINSLIINFHILNLENFQLSMYSVIRATSYASSMYWLAWIIMGKFIFLTLFLAVTLDAFERKYEADIKKGVRQQSMASTMFSRIKKAGQRVKSMAASAAGSNSGRSVFSLWRPDASKRVGTASGSQHHQQQQQQDGSGHPASGEGMLLPGQAAVATTAVVSSTGAAASAAAHGHSSRRRSATDPGLSSRRSTVERRTTGESGGSSSHHHTQHHHHHHHSRHSQQQHERRATGEHSSRSPSPPPPSSLQQASTRPGPVAESVAAQHDYSSNSSSWGAGLRLRRLRAGMQQQYACAKLQPELQLQQQRSMAAFGCGTVGSCSSFSTSLHQAAAAATAEAYCRRTSSSSSGGGCGSGSNSFTLKQEAAAAFAAAAAADALRPCHVIPELLLLDNDGQGWEALKPAASGSAAAGSGSEQPHWLLSQSLGGLASMQRQQQQGTSSSSNSSSRQLSWTAQHEDEDESFTWQELLATVAAINYPNVHRQQQQQDQLQQRQQQLAAAKSAASLGPIAEGLEGPDAAVVDQAAAQPPYHKALPAAADSRHLSFSSANGQITARSLPVPAAVAAAAAEAAGSAAAVGAGVAGRSRPPVAPLQQLVLDDLDRELASLGMQPVGACGGISGGAAAADNEPSTPCLLFASSANATAAGGVGSSWPPVAGQQPDADTADAGGRVSTPPPLPPSAAAAAAPSAASPEGGKPAKDPARRVTLFTESMRHRGECPAPPRSPRFNEGRRPNSSLRGLRGPAAAAEAPTASQLDDWLDLGATQPAGAGGSGADKAGGAGSGRRVSAVNSAANIAQLVLASGSVEPGVTAQAIKRRKSAAAVSFLAGNGALPQGIAESAGGNSQGLHATFLEPSAGSEAQSQASSAAGRRSSRATSDNGSEGGFSDGGHSQMSGEGSRSGAWSTLSGTGRSRSRTFPELSGVSLWVFPQESRFRQALYDTVTHRWFDYAMFCLIILNCVAMAYEYPAISKDNLDGQVLFWSDVVFTAAFTLESVMKVVAFGFRPYLSYFQNQVDIAIVLSSLVMIFMDSLADLDIVKGLRVLRAIKPLRALTRSAGMQLIFKSLTLSLAAMGNVSIVVLLFFLIFAILGVQLFHGRFWRCNDTSVPDVAACVGTFMLDGQEVPRVWANDPYNFDHLGMALVSLFVTATLNGYAEIMDAAMAAPVDPGLQPVPMSNWSAFFFFAAFVLVVTYTLLNLYIGVVFYQFSRIRMQSQTGSAFLTDDQTEWVEMSKLVFRLKPPEKSPVPVNRLRKRLYYFVQGRAFEYAIMAVIVANSALMATAFYGQPPEMTRVVEAINYAFTCIYVVEFGLKVVGLGWHNYWKVTWNKFDCVLLVTGLVDMFLTLLVGPSMASFLKIQKILRLLRLARVVKLMRSMKGLRSLFGTLIVALPAFWNVGGLLALMFFMYAYIGMLLLGSVKRNGALNEHANFERFWTAALTLFKVATNDNWTDIMVACMIGPPDCDPGAGDCGSWVVYPYFVSFVVLVSIIMLQLFTAVIIESFEAQEEQDRWKLRPDHLDEFVELWAEYDDGSGTIDPKDLEAMLLRLSPPLGLGRGASSTDVLRFVFDLDIPLLNGRVPFQRTAYELVRRCSGAEIPEGILKDQINKLVSRAFRNLKADEVLNFSVAVTVMRVQRKWRARMRAAKMKRKKEFRADRGVAPLYADVTAARDTTLKAALQRRQAGDLRWRPHNAYTQQWAAAEAMLAAEAAAAAAAAAAYSRRRSSGGSSSGGEVGEAGGPGGRWSSLAGFRASADGWMQRMTDGFTGGMQRIRGAGSGLFAAGGQSGRRSSSVWGAFGRGSRATSKATSAAASAAGSAAASRGHSNADSLFTDDGDDGGGGEDSSRSLR